MDENRAEDLEAWMTEATQELYKQHRSFTPTYPWVFVRVLEREQKVGSIIVSSIEQNKPVHEGVVLATWNPFVRSVSIGKLTDAQLANNEPRKFDDYAITGPALLGAALGARTRMIVMRSQFEIGDHVLFPHYAGAPIDGFTDKRYRVVSEDCDFSTKGGIFARVDYDAPDTSAHAVARQMVLDTFAEGVVPVQHADTVAAAVMAKLEQRFMLIDREWSSVTLSGR